MMKYRFHFLAVFLLLSSCSENQVKKDAIFDKNSSTGILVFGVTLDMPFANPTFTFRKYDPLTGAGSKDETFKAEPEGSNFRAQTGYRPKKNEHSYFVLNMPKGNWFLECIEAGSNNGTFRYQNDSCFSKGTVAFKVDEGVATYIGEYEVQSGYQSGISIKKITNNNLKAREKLQEFKSINAEIKEQVPLSIKYECVKKMVWIGKYECDPAKMNIQSFIKK